jgi:SAM-dependent methyltransferase
VDSLSYSVPSSDFDIRAIDEAQEILAGATRYNRLIFDEYRRFLGDKVIEVGSAAGNNASYLLDGKLVMLTDNDPRYVALLQEKYGGKDNVRIGQLDATRPPAEELPQWLGTFDTAISLNVIEHIRDDEQALANVAAFVRPGGTGIFIVPALSWLYGSLDAAAGHFRRYSRREFIQKLERAGFTVDRCDYFNPVAVPGWWLSGKVLRKVVIPARQVVIADRLTFLIRLLRPLRLPFGISLLALVHRR